MKRTWIFIALLGAGLSFTPMANVAATPFEAQLNFEAAATNSSLQVSVILQNAADELSYSYEELLNLYDTGLVQIDFFTETAAQVTVLAADGNPVIAILINDF